MFLLHGFIHSSSGLLLISTHRYRCICVHVSVSVCQPTQFSVFRFPFSAGERVQQFPPPTIGCQVSYFITFLVSRCKVPYRYQGSTQSTCCSTVSQFSVTQHSSLIVFLQVSCRGRAQIRLTLLADTLHGTEVSDKIRGTVSVNLLTRGFEFFVCALARFAKVCHTHFLFSPPGLERSQSVLARQHGHDDDINDINIGLWCCSTRRSSENDDTSRGGGVHSLSQ